MTDDLLAAARSLTRIPGAIGALIVDAEAGVPVASDLADGIPETALAALTGSLFRGIAEATATTGKGRPRLLQLEAEGGHLVVAGAGPLLVAVLASPSAQLGLVRARAVRVAEDLSP